jgi:hypothetical protein
MPLAQMGSSLTTLLSSSTCVTVHSRHGEELAALSAGVSTTTAAAARR